MQISSDDLQTMTSSALIKKYGCGVSFDGTIKNSWDMDHLSICNFNLHSNIRRSSSTKHQINFSLPTKAQDSFAFNNSLAQCLRETRDSDAVRSVYLTFIHIKYFESITNKQPTNLIQTEQTTWDPAKVRAMVAVLRRGTKPLSLPPIYIDRDVPDRLFLVDGNHRIMALQEVSYQGYVPVIVCDYLSQCISKKYSRSSSGTRMGGRTGKTT